MLFFCASRPVVLPVPSFNTRIGTVPPPVDINFHQLLLFKL
jgi:hypothetical protein